MIYSNGCPFIPGEVRLEFAKMKEGILRKMAGLPAKARMRLRFICIPAHDFVPMTGELCFLYVAEQGLYTCHT